MKITEQWLLEKRTCTSGIKWFLKQKETDSVKVLKKLMKENKLSDANWLIARIMNHSQSIAYAVFSAEQVIDVFENKYLKDKRPREAIDAAKRCIKDPSKASKKNAAAAAADAADATDDAYDAAAAAAAAAHAAYAAAHAAADAYAAAHAAADAYAAAYAAADAYAAAYAATYAARNEIRIIILNHGIKLLEVL